LADEALSVAPLGAAFVHATGDIEIGAFMHRKWPSARIEGALRR
jgi:hypothetical protein